MANLLKGYTSLLQPVNLLPDVLAGGGGYGGGGYPLSGTIFFTGSYFEKNISSFLKCQFRGENSSSYFTYEFSNRSLHITGHLEGSRSTASPILVIIFDIPALLLKKLTTATCRYTENTNSQLYIRFTNYSGSRTLYYTKYGSSPMVNIGMQQSSASTICFEILGRDTIDVHDFDITITDVAIYEGAYTNPPFCESIAQLNNEGLMGNFISSNYPQPKIAHCGTEGQNKWIRLAKLHISSSEALPQYMRAILKVNHQHTTNNNCFDLYYINILYNRVTSFTGSDHLWADIKCITRINLIPDSNRLPSFSKFRIARNGSSQLFFSGFMQNQTVPITSFTYNMYILEYYNTNSSKPFDYYSLDTQYQSSYDGTSDSKDTVDDITPTFIDTWTK